MCVRVCVCVFVCERPSVRILACECVSEYVYACLRVQHVCVRACKCVNV